MMPSRLIAVVLLVLVVASVSAQDESLADKNKDDIVKHEDILKDMVATDLQELKTKIKLFVENVNSKLTELRTKTKEAIEKLQKDTAANMKTGDTTIKENIKKLEEHMRNKINEVNEKMVDNLKALSEATSKDRKDIRDWNDDRSTKHENILGTHVSLCAYDHGDYAKEKEHVVTYNSARSGFLDGHKSWQVLGGPKHNDEAMAMEVLNRASGTFKVPKNASGLYMFTFSVTMDTADFNSDAGLPHPTEGRSAIYDTTPASNTIFLKLEEEDEVAVRQLMETDIPDYHVSFCGSLIHLEKASESPGGVLADVTNPEFPSAQLAEIVTIENTTAGLADLDLDSFQVKTVDFPDTKLSDELTLTASDPENWRASTWDKDHD